ncbi:restriction endonuclease subunit S [Pseudomonas khavaziana]|uniref:Restriction endonuclease subunit S n=1 Tax=Pseudomonas khavaziana TaxID=2842351 RepID=A0ABZ2DJ72_9PSED
MKGLPPGWEQTTVANLIAENGIFSDGDWVESKDQDPNGSIRLLQLADIGDGVFVNKSNRFINDIKFDQLRCTEVFEGDVLIARMPEPLGRACLAPKLAQRCITVVDVAIVRPGSSSVSSKWLMHFLNAPPVRQLIELQSSGTTRRRISRGNLTKLELPVPPLAEQKRITDKLDSLLERLATCRGRLDQISDILKRFRQSVLTAATSGELTREWREARGDDGESQSFQEADSDSFRDYVFPASWAIRRLADIATITGGVTKDSKKQGSGFTELPYLRVANVQRGYLDLSEVKTIRVPPNRVADLLLRAGDILFNEGGDINKLGRGWIWSGELPACIFQNHVFRARLSDPTFEPRYFSYYGNSRGYEYFLAKGKQTTNLASINKSVLSSLPVAVPPSDEQLEIVKRVDELFLFADRLERNCANAAAKVAALTPAALNKAFIGELVPQDPNDEPASTLLVNIEASRHTPQAEPPLKQARTLPRRPTMSNTEKDAVKAIISSSETDGFSFEDLRALIPGNYESIKTAIFELLSEPNPIVQQIFDKNNKEMRLVRVKL